MILFEDNFALVRYLIPGYLQLLHHPSMRAPDNHLNFFYFFSKHTLRGSELLTFAFIEACERLITATESTVLTAADRLLLLETGKVGNHVDTASKRRKKGNETCAMKGARESTNNGRQREAPLSWLTFTKADLRWRLAWVSRSASEGGEGEAPASLCGAKCECESKCVTGGGQS